MGLARLLLRVLGLGRRRHRDVFAQIVAPANMAAALARVQRRGRENGASDTGPAGFGARELEALRQELLRGRYRPRPVRRIDLPKAENGTRRLTLLAVPDRIAQTAAVQVLTPLLDAELSPAAYGYRPNRSLADALERVQELKRSGLCWVVDADVESCFDRIRHDRVAERLEASIADRRLHHLVRLWLDGLADGPRGLPQGAPLSPLLCNLALDPLDQGLARAPGRLVRFADDFVVLCRSRAEAETARRRAADLLNRQGLRLNAAKTRITCFAEGFFFLGHFFVHDLVLRDAGKAPCEEVLRRAGRARERPNGGWRPWLWARSRRQG